MPAVELLSTFFPEADMVQEESYPFLVIAVCSDF